MTHGEDQTKSASCSAFGRCGACQLLDVPYEEQLAQKQRQIEQLFPQAARVGIIRPILGMEDPFHYRNKVIAPYAPDKGAQKQGRGRGRSQERRGKPRVLTGMYAPGTHQIIPTEGCLLEGRSAKRATLAVRQLMEQRGIAPYDENTGRGFLRHGVARAGRTGELLVTLVTNAEEFPASRSFCRELVKRVPEVTTVIQNVNRRQTNVILGEEERVLYGPGFILDDLCGLRFRISSSSFYQVNAVQAEALYEEAVALAKAGPKDTVIDAYCGTGTIGLVAAKGGAGRVLGVESVGSAVADACQNARHNGISQAEFACVDATAFLQQLAHDRRGAADEGTEGPFAPQEDLILLMDPPRAGSTPEFLQGVGSLRPKRIVYISCDPNTQKRDVDILEEQGYGLRAIQPVDMFPHTRHIENIVMMEPQERMF